MKSDCAVLITAAGLSGRMGVPKALLKWDNKMNFLQKIIATYTDFGCREIIVTLNEDTFDYFKTFSTSSVHFILNHYPELERMHSIQLGLKAIKSSPYCFIQAIDNPFIETKLLKEIYKYKNNKSFVTPTYKDKSGHPILINKEIIEYVCNLNIEKQRLNEVLRQFQRKAIAVEHPEILYNINTMDDYQKLINV
ncbi:MAG: NTP transferase domain-containing protein [Bacteroidetes bacterium]|nr:NTP transferase domain-containing protein [Bacteroidota bacterium]